VRIPEIETANPAQIKTLQEVELQKMLSYVMEHSGYYQRVFKAEKMDVKAIKTLEDLALLPFTLKEDLQKYNAEFLCVDPLEIIDYVRTSGTQGEPVTLALTDKDLERLSYNEAISFACAGIGKSDILQLMTTIDRQFMAGLAYFLGARKLGAGIIRVGSANPEMHWDSILKLKPTYVIAVPSFLLKMIQYAEERGLDLNASGVKAALCIGEPIREDDLRDNALAKRIKKDWNIELYSTYASTEMSTAFTECREHQGGHHHPELVITEIIDEEGKAVPEGEVGELVITNLGIEAMPLIRFKTGDMVRAHHEACPCGRSTMRLGPIVGRKGQMIKYRGTTLYPPALANALHNFEEIESFVIELKADQLGLDEICLKLASSTQEAAFIEAITSHFQAKLRVVPRIEFHDLATVNKLRFPGGGRKPVLVLDSRKS
jgi:phenylacetate-CoA ligase